MRPGGALVLYECDNDRLVAATVKELLIRGYNLGPVRLRHVGGKSSVLKKSESIPARSQVNPDYILVLIDHDPQGEWPHRYARIKQEMKQGGRDTYYYSDSVAGAKRVILILSPRLEEWLLNLCSIRRGVNPDTLPGHTT